MLQSPKALEKIETPRMMFDSIKTKIASTSSSLSRHHSTIPQKMKKLQQEWQVCIIYIFLIKLYQ